MYNLGWVTSCSPLYASKLPDWKHHDALLSYIKKLKGNDLNILCPLPQAGATKMMDRIYHGDRTPLYHTLRDLDIHFSPQLQDPVVVCEILDSLVCDGLALFQDIEPYGVKITPEQQYDNLHEIIYLMLKDHKPVIIVDNDKVCTRPFNPAEDNVLLKLYNDFKSSPSFYVFSPYDQSDTITENFKHVPFEVAPESLHDIVPYSERTYLLRYIGNNYYKSETHVPIFDKLSHFGSVYVSGKYWTEEDKKRSPNVKYSPAVSLSQDNMYACYGNSLLGFSGASKMHDESLYHLRWKEMLIGGTYILRENNSKYMKSVMGEAFDCANLTVTLLKDMDDSDIASFLEYIRKDYESHVNKQRSDLMKFFDVSKWYPVWNEVLKID